jgi:rsbT antagonist protein RsbS
MDEIFEISVQKLQNLLVVTVPRNLLDSQAIELRRELLRQLEQYGSGWVILDFSLVDICDSYFGRFIDATARMVRLQGAEVVVSGLQNDVVETMVAMDMMLDGITIVLNLDRALELSQKGAK